MRAVLWDGKKVLKVRQVKTPKNLDKFKREITKLATWKPSTQVGIGAAGIISGTKIVRSPNIKYLRNFDFTKQLGNPVTTVTKLLGNDAQCFTRANCTKKGTCLAITLGTGIGRGLAKNGKVQKIKVFEYPESWEKEYQKMRGMPKAVMSAEFADFLAEHLVPIVKKYKVSTIVFGGGVTDRNGFKKRMTDAFRQRGVNGDISISRLGKNAVAVGAAMML